jgi:hypothetical protein
MLDIISQELTKNSLITAFVAEPVNENESRFC